MRHLIVVAGVVVNTAEASEEFGIEQGWIASETAGVGWLFDEETGIATPPAQAVVSSYDAAKNHRASLEARLKTLQRKLKRQVAAEDIGALDTQLKISKLTTTLGEL